MSRPVDEKIVKMKMDNSDFQKKATATIGLFSKLESAISKMKPINTTQTVRNLGEVQKAANNLNLAKIAEGVGALESRFSTMGIMAITVLQNITNKIVNMGEQMLKSISLDPLKSGFNEYELKMRSIQTIMSNTQGVSTLQDVTGVLEQLNDYADKTIYSFADMTSNIGTFTAAGVGLEQSATAIKGISNLAAASGSNTQQASTAMYQLSQAISNGKVNLQDWNSVVNAGMGGKLFQDALRNTAEGMGVAIDRSQSFRESLESGWLTSDILLKTLEEFSTNESMLEAATKVRTFTQMVDTAKEALGSGWATTWEIVFGNFEEAGDMWTKANDVISAAISKSADARNQMVTDFVNLGGRSTVINAIVQAFGALSKIFQAMKGGFEAVFPPATGQTLMNIAYAIEAFAYKLWITDEAAGKVKTIFQGLFSILSIGIEIAKQVGSRIKEMIPEGVGGNLLDFVTGIAQMIIEFDAALKSGTAFKDGLDKVADTIVNVATALWDFGTAAWDTITKITTGAADLLGNIKPIFDKVTDFIKDLLSGLDVQDAVNSGFLVVVALAFKKLGGFIDNVGGLLDNFTGIFDSFKDGIANLGGLTDVLKNMATNVKVDSLMKIAIAVGILALSLNLIANMEAQDIAKGLETIAFGLLGMMKALSMIGGMDFTGASAFKASAVLLGISAAVITLAIGLKILSTIDKDEMETGLTGLVVIVGSLVGAMTILSKFSGKILTGAGSMIALAASVVILTYAVKRLSEIDSAELTKGVVSLGIIFIELGVFLKIADKTKLKPSTAVGLVVTAGAILLMVEAIRQIGNIDKGVLIQGMVALTVIMIEMAAFVKIASGTKVMGAAVGMVLVAAAVNMLIDPLETLGEMDQDALAQGLLAMAVALAEVVIAMKLANGSTGGAISILLIANAIAVLVPPLMDLSKLSLKEVATGLGTLAAAFVIVGIAGMVLGPAAPGIIAFSLAITAIGLALALAGIGLAAAAVGLTTLATLSAASITAIIGSLGLLIVGMTSLIPAIIDFGITLIVSLVEGIAEGAPRIFDAGLSLILSFLESLNEHVPDIISVGLQLVTNLANALAENLPPLIEAGANLIVELMNGMANTIRDNDQQLADAMKNIIEAMLEAMITGLVEILNVLLGWIPGFEAMTGDLGGKAKEALREAFDVEEVGKERGQDFVDGVDSKTGASRSIGTKVGQAGKEGAASVDWTSTGSTHASQLANGTSGNSGRVYNSGKGAGEQGRAGAGSVSFYQTGANYAIGLAQGMIESANYSYNAGSYVGKQAAQATRNSLQVKSPSRVAKAIGRFYGEGLGLGIREMGSYVGEQAATMAQKAVDTARSYANAFAEVMDENMNMDPVITPVMDLTNIKSLDMNGRMRVNGLTASAASGLNSITNNSSQTTTEYHINITANGDLPQPTIKKMAKAIQTEIKNQNDKFRSSRGEAVVF